MGILSEGVCFVVAFMWFTVYCQCPCVSLFLSLTLMCMLHYSVNSKAKIKGEKPEIWIIVHINFCAVKIRDISLSRTEPLRTRESQHPISGLSWKIWDGWQPYAQSLWHLSSSPYRKAEALGLRTEDLGSSEPGNSFRVCRYYDDSHISHINDGSIS